MYEQILIYFLIILILIYFLIFVDQRSNLISNYKLRVVAD